MNAEKISSTQNPRIKHLLALEQKSSLRRDEGLFVVEGRRELLHCLNSGYELDTLFVCDELNKKEESEKNIVLQNELQQEDTSLSSLTLSSPLSLGKKASFCSRLLAAFLFSLSSFHFPLARA